MPKNNRNGLDQMPEKSPKLEMLGKEIADLLKKYDVAGVVQLYEHGTPDNPGGWAKYAMLLQPSWSCIEIDAMGKMKIHPPIEDPSNPETATKKIKDTINMVANLRMHLGRLVMHLGHADMALRTHFNMLPPPQPKLPPGQKFN
jgi:hypothetical protein